MSRPHFQTDEMQVTTRVFRNSLLVVMAAVAAFPAGHALADALPIGNEFQANTYTTNSQNDPAVAVDADGDFIVVWRSDGSSGDDSFFGSIQARRFGADGSPVGTEVQVNTYTTDSQRSPSVAASATGEFVVVWHSYGSSGSDSSSASVQGQLFDSNGAAVGAEFQVNTYTTNLQSLPVVAVDDAGAFIVVWQSNGSSGSDSSSSSIQGQRFDADGIPIGGEFQVNTYTSSVQGRPDVALNPAGDFVVVWVSFGSSGSDTGSRSIQGQSFDSAGSPIGDQFQVNTYTTNDQYLPAVAVDGVGDFVVVWQSDGSGGSDSNSYSIQGQQFSSAGAPVGDEFQVNTYTTGYQIRPTVAANALGEFIVVWSSPGSSGSDSSSLSIQGQQFDPAGTAIGDEFQVNTYTTSYQDFSAVAANAGGDFIVAWSSDGSSGSDSNSASVQGQRFAGAEIFADGFESGDTSAWQ